MCQMYMSTVSTVFTVSLTSVASLRNHRNGREVILSDDKTTTLIKFNLSLVLGDIGGGGHVTTTTMTNKV